MLACSLARKQAASQPASQPASQAVRQSGNQPTNHASVQVSQASGRRGSPPGHRPARPSPGCLQFPRHPPSPFLAPCFPRPIPGAERTRHENNIGSWSEGVRYWQTAPRHRTGSLIALARRVWACACHGRRASSYDIPQGMVYLVSVVLSAVLYLVTLMGCLYRCQGTRSRSRSRSLCLMDLIFSRRGSLLRAFGPTHGSPPSSNALSTIRGISTSTPEFGDKTALLRRFDRRPQIRACVACTRYLRQSPRYLRMTVTDRLR